MADFHRQHEGEPRFGGNTVRLVPLADHGVYIA